MNRGDDLVDATRCAIFGVKIMKAKEPQMSLEKKTKKELIAQILKQNMDLRDMDVKNDAIVRECHAITHEMDHYKRIVNDVRAAQRDANFLFSEYVEIHHPTPTALGPKVFSPRLPTKIRFAKRILKFLGDIDFDHESPF
jgi:hypothetical protein